MLGHPKSTQPKFGLHNSFKSDFKRSVPIGRIVERMAKGKLKSQSTWTDVKALETQLLDFDPVVLLGMIQSFYAAH